MFTHALHVLLHQLLALIPVSRRSKFFYLLLHFFHVFLHLGQLLVHAHRRPFGRRHLLR